MKKRSVINDKLSWKGFPNRYCRFEISDSYNGDVILKQTGVKLFRVDHLNYKANILD